VRFVSTGFRVCQNQKNKMPAPEAEIEETPVEETSGEPLVQVVVVGTPKSSSVREENESFNPSTPPPPPPRKHVLCTGECKTCLLM